MSKKWKRVGEIKENRTLRVSGSGAGLYLFLPKKLCETYDIISGDQIKVKLGVHFKRDYDREEKGEGRHGD